MSSLDFTAIDFETANGFRGSACAIGMTKIVGGTPVDTFYTLLRPPAGFDRFDPRNVSIHGITPDQVTNAPRFGDALGEVLEFIGDDILFAHNANFDIGVIESGAEVSGLDVPEIHYGCTLRLSRRVYQLPSHALPKAAAHANFVLDNHHNALADAQACAAIAVDIATRQQAPTIQDLFKGVGMQPGVLAPRPAGSAESTATRQARAVPGVFDATIAAPATPMPDFMRWQDEGKDPAPAEDADPQHPLFDQHLAFTGKLGISRQDAKDQAAAKGAHTGSRVTGATTAIVVGDGVRPRDLSFTAETDPATIHPAMRHRKMRDVFARRRKGQDITVITEPEFIQMFDDNWPPFAV